MHGTSLLEANPTIEYSRASTGAGASTGSLCHPAAMVGYIWRSDIDRGMHVSHPGAFIDGGVHGIDRWS